MPRHLRLPEARRVAIAAQDLAFPRPSNPTPAALTRAIARMGVLQLDSVNVFERSHYLPILARVGPYPKATLDTLIAAHADRPLEQLDPVDREAFDAESAEAGEEAESNLDEVPEVLTTLFGMPYALRPAFVDLVNARAGGPRLDRVDRVYRDLPASTAEMFDPASYFDDLDPAELKAPSFPDADDDRSDVMGAAVLFVMLAERIPPAHAMAAVDGWLGDASFSGRVRDHGKRRVCVQVRTRVATPADVVELTGALEDWKRAMPNQDLISVSKDRRHKTVLFRSCDPGSKVTVGVTGNSRDALLLPVARTQIASGQINLGIPRDRALCVGTEVASRLRPEDLKAEDVTDELRDRVGELIAEAVASC